MLAVTPSAQIVPSSGDRQQLIGTLTNEAAANGVFVDYRQRKAKETLRRQLADLGAFVEYLVTMTFYPADTARRAQAEQLQTDAASWAHITYGIVAGFVQWQLQQGYAVNSVNVRLATVRQYVKLAYQSGMLDTDTYAKILTVKGYQHKDSGRVDEKRSAAGQATRRGAKKAEAVALDNEQIRRLKAQPNTPQGRRDALLICLLLDHGLRCGEIAGLDVTAIDLKRGMLTFDRPKVDKVQTHRLTADTRRAAAAYLEQDAPVMGRLLRGSKKNGELTGGGMAERAITQRVKELGERIGVPGLSAHDGRHSWATRAARSKTDPFALQEAGGWNSLAMPRRYVEAAAIANDGVNLDGEAVEPPARESARRRRTPEGAS